MTYAQDRAQFDKDEAWIAEFYAEWGRIVSDPGDINYGDCYQANIFLSTLDHQDLGNLMGTPVFVTIDDLAIPQVSGMLQMGTRNPVNAYGEAFACSAPVCVRRARPTVWGDWEQANIATVMRGLLGFRCFIVTDPISREQRDALMHCWEEAREDARYPWIEEATSLVEAHNRIGGQNADVMFRWNRYWDNHPAEGALFGDSGRPSVDVLLGTSLGGASTSGTGARPIQVDDLDGNLLGFLENEPRLGEFPPVYDDTTGMNYRARRRVCL